MLSLDSPLWSSLKHAHGRASDTPGLLRQLASLPSSKGDAEPWFSIWSSLAHQGDVYSASFAAVPHVIACLAKAPEQADDSFFHFPAWVEICRQKQRLSVPEDLASAYWEALARLPGLVAAASERDWDESLLCSALASIAAAKGFGAVAEAALEMDSQVAREFIEWRSSL